MLSKSWERGFEAARAASLHSNGPQCGYRLGAALYAGSILLAFGFNDWHKTNPNADNILYNSNTHAEAMCLVRRCHYDNPKNLILYISRSTTNSRQTKKENACSRPCKNCMGLIKTAGVRRIRFYDEDGIAVEVKIDR